MSLLAKFISYEDEQENLLTLYCSIVSYLNKSIFDGNQVIKVLIVLTMNLLISSMGGIVSKRFNVFDLSFTM